MRFLVLRQTQAGYPHLKQLGFSRLTHLVTTRNSAPCFRLREQAWLVPWHCGWSRGGMCEGRIEQVMRNLMSKAKTKMTIDIQKDG